MRSVCAWSSFDHFLGRGRAGDLLSVREFLLKTLAVFSYAPGLKYIQAIQRNSGVKIIPAKTRQFCLLNPLLCCAGELYTERAPQMMITKNVMITAVG